MKSNKLNSTNRKEIGIELRRTHFNLGNDSKTFLTLDPYYLSQYRQDYPAHDPSMHPLPVMDSVTLRRTHFKLGDYKNPYSTTNMEQNKNISKGSHPIATLDQNLKNDLRSSHFILGNSEPSFKTISQSEFYDKSKLKDNPDVNFKAIEKGLRSHNYVLGDDKPDYKSETQAKYIAPQYSGIPKQHISTQELQRSHYNFGNYNDPWVTTQQASYYPKEAAVKFYSKNLTKTNFILGDTNPTFKSVSQETFVPHQIEKSNINKDLAQDLRSKLDCIIFTRTSLQFR